MKKITLYHGTDIETAKKISKSGLKPSKSHWDNCPSHDDHVYLTDTFPIRFGISKTAMTSDDEQKISVVRINVSEDNLYPDEDFLGQIPKQLYNQMGLDEKIADMELIEKTIYYRDNIEKYKHLWKNSLQMLGTCSHKGKIKTKHLTDIFNVQISDTTHYLNAGAEINFGYFNEYKDYHKLELAKILGKKLDISKEIEFRRLGRELNVYNVIKFRLMMEKLNKCFYHTTGNPSVDDNLFIQNGKLIFSTVLHDLIKIENPNVDLSEVDNIQIDVNRLVKDEKVELKYSVRKQEHRAKDMAMKYLKSNYK